MAVPLVFAMVEMISWSNAYVDMSRIVNSIKPKNAFKDGNCQSKRALMQKMSTRVKIAIGSINAVITPINFPKATALLLSGLDNSKSRDLPDFSFVTLSNDNVRARIGPMETIMYPATCVRTSSGVLSYQAYSIS